MRRVLTMGLLLVLAGCGGGEEVAGNKAAPVAKSLPKPMLGGVDLNRPVRASGAAPYWEIHIAPGTIVYADSPDAADSIDFYPVGPKLADGRAVFETRTPETEKVTITLIAQACTAGEQTLPLTAETRIGARTLRGCAGPVPYLPRRTAETPAGNTAAAQ